MRDARGCGAAGARRNAGYNNNNNNNMVCGGERKECGGGAHKAETWLKRLGRAHADKG